MNGVALLKPKKVVNCTPSSEQARAHLNASDASLTSNWQNTATVCDSTLITNTVLPGAKAMFEFLVVSETRARCE
jgi:hypothetical protein